MKLYLRPAVLDDAKMVLEWRNDRQTIENSFTKDAISIENHMKWFSARLDDENCFLYIMMAEDRSVGQIRIDITDHIGEISYMIAPKERKKGYGSEIIKLCDSLKDIPVRAYLGLVKKENEASRRCFLENGYSEFWGGDIYCYFKLL